MEKIDFINDLELQIQILMELKIDADCEVKDLNEKIERKRAILNRCKKHLEILEEDEICYRIYLHILDGMTVTKAIEKVAEENYFNNVKPTSPQTLWKYYYPKLKKMLNV